MIYRKKYVNLQRIIRKLKRKMNTLLLSLALFVGAASPNGQLSVKTTDAKLEICYNQQKVLELADIPFSDLTFVREVKDDYQMLEGKRLHCTNEANEYQAPIGQDARIVMRLYNDGIAFRYEYTGLPDDDHCQREDTGRLWWFL